MKKLLLAVACVGFIAIAATSCGKQCQCTEKDSSGKVIREYEEKQVKVLGTKMPCSYFDEYVTGGGSITCR